MCETSPDSRAARERILGHRGLVVWLTGLSGSGKSTLAKALEARLLGRGILAYVLDGDEVRTGLCADLGFSREDRRENIRRVGHVAALMADAGLVVIAAFISPFEEDRAGAAAAAGPGRFFLVHVATPLDVCAARDPKGLYAKAAKGELVGFTGVDAAYEPPGAPDLVLDTAALDLDTCLELLEQETTARIATEATDGSR